MNTAKTETVRPGSLALDQWRGMALVLVLVAHAFHESGRVDGLGRVGVNLFFFISGILVFRSLASSQTLGAEMFVRSFWFRRMRRLYPALLAYVWLLCLTKLLLLCRPPSRFDYGFEKFFEAAPWILFYCSNYLSFGPPVLGHIWSLACEMQFYLLAPMLYLGGGRTASRRNLVFGGLLFLLVVMGLAGASILANPLSGNKYHFEFAVWPMMAGFFCEYKKNYFASFPHWLATWTFWPVIAICTASLLLMVLGFKVKLLVVATGALLLLPCWLAYTLHKPIPSSTGQTLRWLGERTYSIYLWQQPFTICFFLPVPWWPVGALLSIPVGALWFRWFEFPYLSAARQTKGNAA